MTEYYSRTVNSKDEWETPQYFFDLLEEQMKENGIFYARGFTLDPCASNSNHKCNKYYTKKEDGLKQDWRRENVFVNPPYSDIKDWCKKSYEEGCKSFTVVVLLIPNRTDTQYWHKYVMKAYKIYLVEKRINFELNGKPYKSPNFGSVVVVFKRHCRKYPKLRGPKHR